MLTAHESAALANIVDEQNQVFTTLNDLRCWWAAVATEGDPPYDQLMSRLHAFRDLLAMHFQHEETLEEEAANKGYCAASLSHTAEVTNTHAMLLADLDLTIHKLQVCYPGMNCWAEVTKLLDTLLVRIHEHEQTEVNLLSRFTRQVSERGEGI